MANDQPIPPPPQATPGMPKDEYELVPHNQLEYLRHEVERIKRNPFGDSRSSKDLLSAMDHMNKNLTKLIAIFETANDEIVRDYKDQANTEKINRVLEQNEKLAKGIVAIADLLKEVKDLKSGFSAAEESQSEEMMPSQAPPGEQNPFLPSGGGPRSQPGIGPPGMGSGGAPPPGGVMGRPGPQMPRNNLPPIDLGDIPPPPR